MTRKEFLIHDETDDSNFGFMTNMPAANISQTLHRYLKDDPDVTHLNFTFQKPVMLKF